ncbi:MAG: hypothetical protein R3E64_01315 [Halioglobus sp.]
MRDLPGHLAQKQQQNDAQANYAHKILKTEGQIDWCGSAIQLDRKIRAFNPFPICYSTLNGCRIRVWQASPLANGANTHTPGTIVRTDEAGIVVACGEGALALEVLQLEGGKALSAKQLLGAQHTQFVIGRQFAPLPTVEN